MPLPPIEPPLLNSSNPWATNAEDLQALFDCPHTGAVTTRTSLLDGFEHDDEIHQYTFFNPSDHFTAPDRRGDESVSSTYAASLNTLGYSPLPLAAYLNMIPFVLAKSRLHDEQLKRKVFIISVTGSADAVGECYQRIQQLQLETENPLCMEINLSCPNIPGKPPPAYSAAALEEYLTLLSKIKPPEPTNGKEGRRVTIGIKTPPYTYHDEFSALINALLSSSQPRCPVDFISATNTLGSCLVLASSDGDAALNSASGVGIGGMAGAPLHPLSLGNVKTVRGMLDEHEGLRGVDIIGIGGVGDQDGFRRMRAVGAKAVGVGTALGREGVGVFGKILGG